jgi:hypothetical protein
MTEQATPAPAATKPVGKVRSPWLVVLYSIITLGIYAFVWWYKIFNEMHTYRNQGISGGIGILLVFLCYPALYWLLPANIGNMYAEDSQEKPITGLSGFWVFLPGIGGLIWLWKCQNRMNEFWESKGAVA